MGKTKEMWMQMSHEDCATEFYARLELLRECKDDLISDEVSPQMKSIILKAILA
tara:strand:- start:1320 stop:1481 length:162 start_codon:yes stop_codon:yes gene_type:complete